MCADQFDLSTEFPIITVTPATLAALYGARDALAASASIKAVIFDSVAKLSNLPGFSLDRNAIIAGVIRDLTEAVK